MKNAILALEFKTGSAKVDQKANIYTRGSEVIDQLDFVCRSQGLDGFEFNYDLISDAYIRDKMAYPYVFIINVDWVLAHKRQACLGEFVDQGILINRLEEAWPQGVVHFHCETDDLVSERLIFHGLSVLSDAEISIKKEA